MPLIVKEQLSILCSYFAKQQLPEYVDLNPDTVLTALTPTIDTRPATRSSERDLSSNVSEMQYGAL